MELANVTFTPQLVAAVVVVVLASLYMFCKLFLDKQVKNFKDKYVLITGCDSGFGKMAALRLDKLGFHVIGTCLTTQGMKKLNEEASDRMTTFIMDVTNSSQIKDVYREVKALIPNDRALWGVINNAGIALVGPIDWISLENFKKSADVNVWGMIDVSKTFLPLLKNSGGRFVNIVSIAGRSCLPFASSYSVSKFAAEAFSDALRRETKPFGIRVSVLEPGFFHTDLTSKEGLKKQWFKIWDELDQETKDDYGEECFQNYMYNGTVGLVDTLCSHKTYKVIDAITHAVTSTCPKNRYPIGWDTHLLWIWLSRLPESVGDFILEILSKKKAIPQRALRR